MTRISKAAIRRLRLQPADIVIVRDSDTMHALGRVRGDFPPCPIVVAPEGVHRLSKGYLRKLLEKPDA